MKSYKSILAIILCMVMVLLPSISAFGETITIDERLKTDLIISDSAKEYPAISVKGFWDLMPFVEDTKADLVLTQHDTSCGIDCMSEFQIVTYQDSPLIEDIKFYRLDEGKTEERSIRSYQFQYYGDVPDYTTECSPAKLTEEELKNETKPYEICVQVESGSHKDWINYNIGEELRAGTYDVKLLGQKAPYMSIDWIIKTQGKMITEWATWGNISTGSQAEVRLNSPANNSIQYVKEVTTNASANVTNGATLVNATLYDNSTGSWGARNSTTYGAFHSSISTGYTLGGVTSAETGYSGLKVTITGGNKRIINATKKTGDNSQYFFILDSAKSPLASAIFSGNTATINYDLVNGTTYYFVGNGTSQTRQYESVTYPKANNGYFQVIGGIFNSGDSSVQARTIDSVFLSNTSGSSITKTFTNTYPLGSNIKWNYRFCDSDGACGFAPQNFTFTVDGTAPTINLNYPTSLINYGAVNSTLQLNFTATDSNLDKVWYNYNGTNITITGATSGTSNISNITLSTKKNITIYANDTAGNLNASLFSWDYMVFENGRTITTPTVETTLETFTINITANTSLTSVYLNWNGTEYSASGSAGVYTKTLTIPAVSVAETIPVYWRFDYSGTNINSSTSNQVVNKLVFQLCNATVNKTLINFTTKSAENPFPSVNSSFKSNWQLSASEGAIPTTYNYEDLIIDNSSYAFCTNTNTTTFYVSAEIEYAATGYATNFYYLNNAELIATSVQNITLYLLNDSRATTTVLRVEDTAQKPYEDYTVQIQSYDVGTGTFYTVGMATTDYKGEDVVYLNWYDTLYKFIVLDENNNVVKTTGTTKITGTPTIIEITTDIEFVYDKFENFIYTLYYDNTTQNFVLTYTMPSGEVDSACLRVYKEDPLNQTLICDTCETSSSATVFCNIAGRGNGRYTAVFYALGSHQLIDWISEYIGGRFQEQVYAALGNEDASFYAFLFAGIVTVALFVNAVFGIIALLIGLLGASALGFTAIQWTEMMGIIIVGGFIIWIIKK